MCNYACHDALVDGKTFAIKCKGYYAQLSQQGFPCYFKDNWDVIRVLCSTFSIRVQAFKTNTLLMATICTPNHTAGHIYTLISFDTYNEAN